MLLIGPRRDESSLKKKKIRCTQSFNTNRSLPFVGCGDLPKQVISNRFLIDLDTIEITRTRRWLGEKS